ncbi:COPII coat Sec23p-Sfb3p heterodimer component [Apophysomyces sp. BC1021]|nr:COPII coat Sec23p-Sfb3p heterodimer component [Apophysomyces sp. BC1021]
MQAQGPNGETTPGHDRWNPQYPSTNMQAPNMISTQANRPPPGVVRPPGVRPPMPFQARPPPAFAAQPGYRPSVHPVLSAPTSAPSAARPPAPAAEFSPSAPVDTLSPQMANMNIQTAPAFKPGRSKRVYAPSADIPKAPSNAQPPVYPNAQRSSYSTTQPPLHSNVQQPPGYAPAGPGVPQQLSPSVPKSRIDPDQIPSPVQLQMKDQELYLHQQYGTFSQDMSFPLSTTDFRAVDQGNCNPRFMRCTLREVPQAHDLVRDAELPFGIVVQPLAALPAEDGAVPVVSPGADGPVRCRRCHGYLNCWCNFIDGGRKFVCNLCGFDNEVPENYFCPVDMTGRRVDTEQRPELRHGTVEFEVPEEYWMRDPQPLNYVFAVDVSWSAVKSGMLSSFCAALKQTLPLLTGGTKISIMTFDSVSSLDQAQMMVVSDIDDIFLPLAEGFLVDPQDSRSVIEDLLDNLPRMFNDNKIPSAVLGAAIKGASLSLKVTGGKLCVFQSVLPTIGPGTLKNRDDSKLYGTDKENKLFTPQDDFYTAMAKECSKDGVSIDLWLFPQNTYVDVSTLGALSELTGGETHYYYNFDHERSSLRFTNDFECSFRREQGYDAALRLRCSNGITIENQYGNFHMTNATDIVLAGIDADKSIGFTLDHDSKLTDNSMAYFQCALLYTTQTGQRRVRLHNMCLPVTSNIPALFRQADLDATINLITKKVISQSTKVGLLQLASDLEKQCVNILAAYRKYCATDASTGQLILPESFKLLPVYTLALRKSVVLRKDVSITADNRVYNLRKIKAAGLAATLRWLYPRMVKVHELEGQDVTPMERLSYLRLHPTGIYLIDSRDTTFIWVGQHASTDLLEHIFGVTQLDQVDPRMVQLPSLDHPLSQRLRNMTQSPTITVVRQSLDPENELAQTLVEDETYGQMTYVDYLCLVHKQIQNNLEKEKRDTLMASASIWAQRY